MRGPAVRPRGSAGGTGPGGRSDATDGKGPMDDEAPESAGAVGAFAIRGASGEAGRGWPTRAESSENIDERPFGRAPASRQHSAEAPWLLADSASIWRPVPRSCRGCASCVAQAACRRPRRGRRPPRRKDRGRDRGRRSPAPHARVAPVRCPDRGDGGHARPCGVLALARHSWREGLPIPGLRRTRENGFSPRSSLSMR